MFRSDVLAKVFVTEPSPTKRSMKNELDVRIFMKEKQKIYIFSVLIIPYNFLSSES